MAKKNPLFAKIRSIVLKVMLFLFAWSLFWVILYAFVPVYFTPLMGIRLVQQVFAGESPKCTHRWIKYNDIAPSLKRAVVASEDNLFVEHHGFDFQQIEKAIEETDNGRRKRQRGASTISQQTAKNVFLWNGGGFIRKGLEAYYTVLIELIWGKKRIMEVYLNSIEMGNGIYGAEAVAQEHFGRSAKKLSAAQSALIAASLPNPRRFNSAKPSGYMRMRQAKILLLMGKIQYDLD